MKHQGFEHLFDVLAQALGYMRGAEVVFIHFVWDEFVFYLCLVQQTGYIGLVYFFFRVANSFKECRDAAYSVRTVTWTYFRRSTLRPYIMCELF